MSKRSRRVRDGVSQLSPSTYLLDCPKIVRDFLKSSREHRGASVGKRPVFVLRRKNRIVRVAWSVEELSVEIDAAIGATRYRKIASVTVRTET